MRVTTLLCDHAQVSSDGKLFISGANINRLNSQCIQAPYTVDFALAVMIHIPWQATNQAHKLSIELVNDDPNGAKRVPFAAATPNVDGVDHGKLLADFNAGRAPQMVPGEETTMPLVVPFHRFNLPDTGGYYFDICVDGTSVATVPFRVESITSTPFRVAG